MFSSAASSTRWLKRRSCEASPTMLATVSRSGPDSRRAASSSRRVDALPSTADSSRSSRASIAVGTGPLRGAPRSTRSTRPTGRKRRPALRSASRSARASGRSRSRRSIMATTVIAAVPTNSDAPNARPSWLQLVRPNSACGRAQAGSCADHPDGSSAGASITQAQTTNAATMPAIAARGGSADARSRTPVAVPASPAPRTTPHRYRPACCRRPPPGRMTMRPA